ncbi:C2H2 finger domain protein [Fusarium beomiforme]|uniref:C2H2 finger domain protein n=1 Tax=Fusarium beomiforme TaxID=44412 RepID=A0A9P5DX83_9HYPO|nr:C2H2 finger domain protein [Fusarium beomiforme]
MAVMTSDYKTGSGTLPSGKVWCEPCGYTFRTWEQYFEHKRKMGEQGRADHIHCEFCGIDFHTEIAKVTHIQHAHPEEQNLFCTGCGKGPFVRVGGLVSHVTKDCPSLSVAKIEAARGEKMEFSKALTAMTQEPLKKNYESYMPENRDKGLPTTTWGALEGIPAPFTIEQSEFPSLGEASSTALQPSKQANKENDWIQGKNLFPNAPAAQRPTVEQLKQAAAPNAKAAFDRLRDLDPDQPHFNVSRWYSEYTQKFGCPHERCGKTFRTAQGLKSHLKSEAHSNIMYRCPYCLDIFKSLTAITSHAESSSTKCKIRNTDEFNAYFDQLLGGMVSVGGERNKDGTLRYEMSKSFGQGPSPGRHLVEPKENPKTNGGDPYKDQVIHW